MRQSNTLPTLLVVAGVACAIWCMSRFVGGDLAWEEAAIGFASSCLLAALGAHEVFTTELHESRERSGF
jgi:hypothetical protein